MKKVGILLIKLVVLLVITIYFYIKFDFEVLFQHFLNIHLTWFLLSILTAGWMYVLAAVRWQKVVHAMDQPLNFKNALSIFMIGTFFSQFLFATIGGDAVRIWLARRHSLTLRTAFNSTFFDRLSGLVAIAFFMIFSLPVYLQVINERVALISLLLLVFSVFMGVLILFHCDRIPYLSHLRFFQASFGKVAPDARQVFLKTKKGLAIMGYSIIVLALTCLIVFCMGRAMGQNFSMIAYFVMIPPVMLMSILPISLGGWGVREGSMVIAFGFLGMQGEVAIALSIWFGLILLLVALPGGFLWLFSKSRFPRAEIVALGNYNTPPA